MKQLNKALLTLLVFTLLFVGYFHRISAYTQDLGRHLLLGKIILQTHHIPKTNLLSYTYPDFPFINHHYLSEVVFYLIHSAFGDLGLLFTVTVTMFISFGLLFFYCLPKTNIFALTIVSLLMLGILFERTDIRPEMFSFLFLSVFLIILYRFRQKPNKAIYLLPILMLLWVNMHVYFFVGVIIVGLFLADNLVLHRKNLFSSVTKTLCFVFVTVCLTMLLNPNGIQGALYPLHAFKNYGYAIEENQNFLFLEQLGFHKSSTLYFKLSLPLLFLSLLFAFKKTKPIDWLFAVVFSIAGFIAVRNFPLFALAVFIPFSTNFSYMLEKIASLASKKLLVKKLFVKQIFVLMLISLFIWQIVAVSKKQQSGFSVDHGAEYAADFFIKNKLHGPIFNNFDIGSYFSYRIYPLERVFVDGRPEAYPADFFQQTYIPMQQDKTTFSEIEKKYHFNAIFFSHTDQTPWAESFLKNIVSDQSWRIVYLDDFVIVLLKDTKENQKLTERFAMQPPAFRIDFIDGKDTPSLLRLAGFFNKVDAQTLEAEMYEKVLTIEPNNCLALHNLGILYAQNQNPLTSFLSTRYLAYCSRLIQ